MGFLDKVKKALGSGSLGSGSLGSGSLGSGKSSGASGGGRNSFGDESWAYWVHAQCGRCGEPLRARIDMRNDPSEEDDGTWIVRKGLTGSGRYYCFQMVDVTLRFDRSKKAVLEGEAAGGKLITAEEYPGLHAQWQEEQARLAQERAQQQD